MKQGSGNNSKSAGKVEPRSQGINPGAAGQPGIAEVRTRPQSVHEARGVQAPMVKPSNHKSGSQGRH